MSKVNKDPIMQKQVQIARCNLQGIVWIQTEQKYIKLKLNIIMFEKNNQKSAQKPKKIVINNLRKSILFGSSGLVMENPQQGFNIFDSMSLQNQQIYQPLNNSGAYHNRELNRIGEQLAYYKQKHDQSLIKVKLLAEKLSSFGGLTDIPDRIKSQISETDGKIQKMQQIIYFKRSKQMKKLKKKVSDLLVTLDFEITGQDMNKIQDEVQLILFMIDVFTEKYNHMMSEKTQIDQLIQKLKSDTIFDRQKIEQHNYFLEDKLSQQTHYIRDLQLQIFGLKREMQNFGKATSNIDVLIKNPNGFPAQKNYTSTNPGIILQNNQGKGTQNVDRVYEQVLKGLQIQNEQLRAKSNKLESMVKNYEYEVINYKRRIEDFEFQLNNQRVKSRDLEEELLKAQKQQIRWRQRYQVMERQKNERIGLLQKDRKMVGNINHSFLGNSTKRGGNLREVKQKIVRQQDISRQERDENSQQQYFDLS